MTQKRPAAQRARRARSAKARIFAISALAPFLLRWWGVRPSLKSLPIPVAEARDNFSDVVAQARQGRRIKLTRHGKNVAWLIGKADREHLRKPARKKTKRSGR